MSKRTHINFLINLINQEGVNLTSEIELINETISFLKTLYSRTDLTQEFPNITCKTKIIEFGNNYLNTPFTMEELKYAVFSTHIEKASGPDGYSSKFYQNTLGQIKREYSKCYVKLL